MVLLTLTKPGNKLLWMLKMLPQINLKKLPMIKSVEVFLHWQFFRVDLRQIYRLLLYVFQTPELTAITIMENNAVTNPGNFKIKNLLQSSSAFLICRLFNNFLVTFFFPIRFVSSRSDQISVQIWRSQAWTRCWFFVVSWDLAASLKQSL